MKLLLSDRHQELNSLGRDATSMDGHYYCYHLFRRNLASGLILFAYILSSKDYKMYENGLHW